MNANDAHFLLPLSTSYHAQECLAVPSYQEPPTSSASSSAPPDTDTPAVKLLENLLDEITSKSVSAPIPEFLPTSPHANAPLLGHLHQEKPMDVLGRSLSTGMRRSAFDFVNSSANVSAQGNDILRLYDGLCADVPPNSSRRQSPVQMPSYSPTSCHPQGTNPCMPEVCPSESRRFIPAPRPESARLAVAPAPSKFCHLCSRYVSPGKYCLRFTIAMFVSYHGDYLAYKYVRFWRIYDLTHILFGLTRTQPLVRAICSNREFGRCKKTVCRACFAEHPEWNWDEATAPGSRWECPHCTSECAHIPKARCAIYKRVNQKRRTARLAKKAAKVTKSTNTCIGRSEMLSEIMLLGIAPPPFSCWSDPPNKLP